jgi:hypothetical protein
MEKKVNQQQTLFRFVTLRAPQIPSQEEAEIGFVEQPRGLGYFSEKVETRPPGQSVAAAMEEAARGYEPADVEKLREIYRDFYGTAEWLASNKYSFNPGELFEKARGMDDMPEPGYLWDNLFYQVLRQSNFYVKDLVIQLLVLAKVISFAKSGVKPEDLDGVMRKLAAATVLLPLDLFPEEPTESAAKAASTKPIFSSKQLDRSLNVALAQSGIDRNDKAISELSRLQAEYMRKYDEDYNIATERYETEANAAYAAATIVEKTRTDCATGCVETYYVYENLVLPTFEFTPPKEIDPVKLKAELTADSYYVLESLSLLKETTFDAIISGIEKSITEFNDKLYSNQPKGQNLVSVGGMIFQRGAGESGNTFVSSSEIPFTAFFEHTSMTPEKGKVQLILELGFPNGDVVDTLYSATFPNGTVNTMGQFVDTANGTMLNITLYNIAGLPIPAGSLTFELTAEITLSNGMVMELTCTVPVKDRLNVTGVAQITTQVPSGSENTTPFIPNKFGIRRLGIADYRKVVAEVCCYREAEVSHIQNIMAREFLSKTTTRERIEETTTTIETQNEKENLTDSTTNNRFEMQTEISKVLQQDKDLSASVNLHTNGTNWSLDAGGNYATHNSKEESNRQAINQATEITERAMERIVTKFRKEVVTKITESFKEENSHIYDNREGTEHVSAIYRFINAVYKNQIYNYGKRLMYEFMIPEPGNLYRSGIEVATKQVQPTAAGEPLVKPKDPITLGLYDATAVTEQNYLAIAANYRAKVQAPPTKTLTVGKAYQGAKGDNGGYGMQYNDLKINEGYQLKKVIYRYTQRSVAPNNTNTQLIIGTKILDIQRGNGYTGTGYQISGFKTKFDGSLDFNTLLENQYNLETLPIAINAWDLGAYTIVLTVKLERTDDTLNKWKLETYDAIIEAYRERLDEFYGQISTIQDDAVQFIKTNPLFYRDIEKITLKRNCISYLQPSQSWGQTFTTGDTFADYQVDQNESMDKYASHAKFMEQAFEWDIMSYNFYPYYWGNSLNWLQLYQSDSDDPLFRSFMQSGMARVIVSVRPGFEKAVMHYMKFGVIWNGGEMPVIGDDLYKSIVDELAQPEYTIDQTWETVVPTSLIGIQKEGLLVDVNGLPCGGGCEGGDNPLKANPYKLGDVIPVTEEPTV